MTTVGEIPGVAPDGTTCWQNVYQKELLRNTKHFLNTGELLPGSPKQIFIATVLEWGLMLPTQQGQKVKFMHMS